MNWIMTLTVLAVLMLPLYAQTCSCETTQAELRQLAARVEYLISLQSNANNQLATSISNNNKALDAAKTELVQNQDINARNMVFDITSELQYRTDPVRYTMPFILGFGFLFFLFSAIAIKFRFFVMREMLVTGGD